MGFSANCSTGRTVDRPKKILLYQILSSAEKLAGRSIIKMIYVFKV